MVGTRVELDERFRGDTLDTEVWLPHYLPHWSSRVASAATYSVRNGALRLSIPVEQDLWCADQHPEPLRVSAVQSGSFAGPLGSSIGQQPFQDGLLVREEQPTMWGYTPLYAHVEVRMRAVVSARSMFAFWMSGIEDRPERSGEICVAEVFGSGIRDGTAEVGMGIHRFRDATLAEEFSVLRLTIDVRESHTYGVDWRPGSVAFSVDGQPVHRLGQAPDYPVQLMLGVLDFPGRAPSGADVAVPELVILPRPRLSADLRSSGAAVPCDDASAGMHNDGAADGAEPSPVDLTLPGRQTADEGPIPWPHSTRLPRPPSL